jgi:ATP-binding cassette, subfamily B, bacterial PglK
MVFFMAVLETVGVASVMPFLAVLGDPDSIRTQRQLSYFFDIGGFETTQSFLVALATLSFVIVVSGSLFRLGTHYVLHRFAEMRRHSVSRRLLEGYLRQPYEFFLNRNTTDLSKSILSEVDELTENVFQPGIQLISYLTTAVLLFGFLIVMDPAIALAVTVGLGGTYVLIYLCVRGLLGRIGRQRAEANRARFKAAGEALGGIKDIRILGCERTYLDRFREPSRRFSRFRATNKVVAVAPKYLIEAIGFGGVLALAVILLATRGDLGQALPLLGVFAFAGYRLLPAAQHIFASVAKLRFGWGAVEVVAGDLESLPPEGTFRIHQDAEREGPDPTGRSWNIRNLSYKYPGSEDWAIKDISIEIEPGMFLGVMGHTGAGKSTLVDLILGLLTPTTGSISLGSQSLAQIGLLGWREIIGYVPQSIYMTDASIAENIAFGIDRDAIDRDMLLAAARAAQVHEFVRALPKGYDTIVGERGVRLSGGQKQRIGIARALYRPFELLILDEATSALDGATEARVMKGIADLGAGRSVITIAHRVSTLMGCDSIIVLSGGRILSAGRYEELIATDSQFRELTRQA